MTVMGMATDWGIITYNITIACKDGKYKYIIDNIYHSNQPYYDVGEISNTPTSTFHWRKIDQSMLIDEVDVYMNGLILNLKNGMDKPTAVKSDW